jgi:hypothetical protein
MWFSDNFLIPIPVHWPPFPTFRPSSVADPGPFDTDPDPAFQSDPDHAFQSDPDPERFKEVMYLKQYFLYIFT